MLQALLEDSQEPPVAVTFVNIRSVRAEYRPRILGRDYACSLAAPTRMLSD